jgi:hypothetical protein
MSDEIGVDDGQWKFSRFGLLSNRQPGNRRWAEVVAAPDLGKGFALLAALDRVFLLMRGELRGPAHALPARQGLVTSSTSPVVLEKSLHNNVLRRIDLSITRPESSAMIIVSRLSHISDCLHSQ